MARPLRLEFSGAVYHVTARGNAREAIYADDRDRRRFIHIFAEEIAQQQWLCYAWCLMDNHYHLLFETPEPNLIAGMRRLNQVYTQSYNRRHGRTGHVLQGRYKAIIVEKQSHLLELCRYVVLNPVRAGLVETVEDWPWSSYGATAGVSPVPSWLRVDWVLDNFAVDRDAGQAAYRRFVAEGTAAASPWEALRGQIWLGGKAFRQRMSGLVAQQNLEAVPKMQTHPERPLAEDVVSAVARAFEIAQGAVLDRSHQTAFKTAVFLLRRACNLPLADVARLVGVSASRISRIQAEVEKGGIPDKAAKLLEQYKDKH